MSAVQAHDAPVAQRTRAKQWQLKMSEKIKALVFDCLLSDFDNKSGKWKLKDKHLYWPH